jgi:hypothetical protein
MNRKGVYLIACVLGMALPYTQFMPWVVAQHGVPMGLFLRELFANRISAFFGMDVLVSSVVLIFFVLGEGQRLGVRHLWLPIAATLTVGASLGFPLFLYLREGALDDAGGRVWIEPPVRPEPGCGRWSESLPRFGRGIAFDILHSTSIWHRRDEQFKIASSVEGGACCAEARDGN